MKDANAAITLLGTENDLKKCSGFERVTGAMLYQLSYQGQ